MWTKQDADMAQKFANFMTHAKYDLSGKQVIEMFACIKWFNGVCEEISVEVLGENEPKIEPEKKEKDLADQ